MSTASAQTTAVTPSAFIARNWRDPIRPRKLEVDPDTLTPNYGKFACEPLERGFGTTIGNGLRRVLLSSLQGAAITAVKIEGALHEFTSLPEVAEDVTDIVLNLKEVIIRSNDGKPHTVRIEKDGEGKVTGKDIQCPEGIEVLNPDHHIMTCSKGAKVRIELDIGIGRGYVPAERNKQLNMPVGVVPIDSLFSPIRKVNFSVTNARVGQQTDYDRLTLEVWTNGTVKPEDAVAYAAKIFKDQLSIFINFQEGAPSLHRRPRSRRSSKSSTRICGSRSTISSFQCVRRTVCRTRTFATSASSCRRPSPTCSRPRTLVASRSRKSKRSWPAWGSPWA
jgi:DNA-directed RNA polymerase subunit alpha